MIENLLASQKARSPAAVGNRNTAAEEGIGMTRRRREQGTTMVEFAFTVTLLFVMLFGIIDFGRALYAYHFVSHAARSATRWAAVNGADCHLDLSCPYTSGAASTDVTTYVNGMIPPGIDASQVGVNTTWPGNSTGACSPLNSPGCPVQVTVTYNFPFLVPLVHSGSITMSSTSNMVIAH